MQIIQPTRILVLLYETPNYVGILLLVCNLNDLNFIYV